MNVSPIEQALLRAWIKSVPVTAYVDTLPEGTVPTVLLAELRQRLTLKARRLDVPWVDFFLTPRLPGDAWTQQALTQLEWLLRQADLTPALDHPLAFWLDEPWHLALTEAGLTDFNSWFIWRNTQGADWWRQLTGIGQRGAKALTYRVQSLWPTPPALPGISTSHSASLTTDTLLRPLERLSLAADLDGSQGSLRGHECFIPAENDLQAIRCWLARHDPNSHTYRAYQREAERLLLWALVDRHQPLSSLNTVDLADYRRFLQNPEPSERWIGPNRPKTSPDWKPFTGALSLRSVQHAEMILANLFGFLLSQGYLRHNPMQGLPKLSRNHPPTLNVQHCLTPAQWQFLTHFVQQQQEETTL